MYKIVRYFKSGRKKTIKVVSSLEIAKLHCKDPRTKSLNWFDGFVKI